MRVLIVSQWYSPEPDGRVSALAEALVARGHEVDVVTAFPHYPVGRLYDGYRIRWRQRERKNGVIFSACRSMWIIAGRRCADP